MPVLVSVVILPALLLPVNRPQSLQALQQPRAWRCQQTAILAMAAEDLVPAETPAAMVPASAPGDDVAVGEEPDEEDLSALLAKIRSDVEDVGNPVDRAAVVDATDGADLIREAFGDEAVFTEASDEMDPFAWQPTDDLDGFEVGDTTY